MTSWHQVIDERNLELARATADCLRADPAGWEVIRGNLRRIIEQDICGGLSNGYVRRWKAILDTGDPEFILGELTRDDETGAALRQADPFTRILPQETRNRIMESYESRRSAFTFD